MRNTICYFAQVSEVCGIWPGRGVWRKFSNGDAASKKNNQREMAASRPIDRSSCSMRLIPKSLKTPACVLLILISILLARITAIDKVYAIATDTGEKAEHRKTAPIENAQEFKNTRELIQYLVRAAGSNANSPFNAKLALNGKFHQEFAEWMSKNGESISGTLGGPFESTDSYASVYRNDKIYVHVLDWKGKNNLTLSSVTDRLVKKAWVLNGATAQRASSWGIVRQHPWGLLIVVPESERPDDVDTIIVLEVERDVSELKQPRVVEADAGAAILLRGDTAKLTRGLKYNAGPDWIENWTSVDETVSWTVRLRGAGEYKLATTYACSSGSGGSEFEIVANDSKVADTVYETNGWAGDKQNFEKKYLTGKLNLSSGINSLAIHVSKKSKTNEIMRLHAMELTPLTAEEASAAAKERARKQRASTDWFVAAKYGVMFHWTTQTQPHHGTQKPFCEAVRDFNIDAFADMVKETGAGYVIFTAVHGTQWFPAPIRTIDKILPGRTCERDLIGEIADALSKRGVKLILYYHQGVGDYEWSRASGFLRKDKSEFFKNEHDILTEVGQRYGNKFAGYWFDDRYPFQPFEQLYQATKVGNEERIVSWNSWILPKTTEFQEYYAGEFGGGLILPEKSYFEEGGPASALQPHGLIFLDDPWIHGYPDKDIAAPLFTTQKLIDYVKACIARKLVITMNLGIYQNGTVSPATLEQMRALRRAIREKQHSSKNAAGGVGE